MSGKREIICCADNEKQVKIMITYRYAFANIKKKMPSIVFSTKFQYLKLMKESTPDMLL